MVLLKAQPLTLAQIIKVAIGVVPESQLGGATI